MMQTFLETFDKNYTLGILAHSFFLLRLYEMKIVHVEAFSSCIDANDKLSSFESFLLTRIRRREINRPPNFVEMASLMSLNFSPGWLGLAASPFCAFFASHLQQKLSDATVAELISQSNRLEVLTKLGNRIPFPRPASGNKQISIVFFVDADGYSDYGQLSYVSRIIIDLAQCSIFHVLLWMWHKSKRPTTSIGAAEVLAASEKIDEGKTLKKALSTLVVV